MKVILKIVNKKEQVEQPIMLFQNFVLGRGTSATYQVKDEKISSKHCKLLLKNDRLEISDLDSKNGTYLNGIRIEQSEVFLGDELKIGDTIVTLSEDKMDAVSIELLTFPGPFKERINYELKADFTGARIQNQIFNKEHPEEKTNNTYQSKEISLRKKARSFIRLSKQEIKSRHRMLTMLAGLIDFAFLALMIAIPIYFVNEGISSGKILGAKVDPESLNDQKVMIIAIAEAVLVMGFIYLNTNFLKYTIGEKLMGIEDLHSKQ